MGGVGLKYFGSHPHTRKIIIPMLFILNVLMLLRIIFKKVTNKKFNTTMYYAMEITGTKQ
jgi:hypothetical protein